ncbi:MAG: flagellar basal body rod protein FlgB [Fibrobacterales bacterium]
MLAKLGIYDRTSITVASKSLDASALRSKALANNLANVSTPGYNRIEVRFEEQLREALNEKNIQGDRTSRNHFYLGRPDLNKINPQAYRAEDPTLPGEINNVDVDIEMSKLAENQILFSYGAKFISERMADVNAAIKLRG